MPAFQGVLDRNVCQPATADHITESHHMQGLSRGSAICAICLNADAFEGVESATCTLNDRRYDITK